MSSALRRRTLTAFVLIPLVIAGVLWAPPLGFALCAGLIMLVAAWEWSALAGLARVPARAAYLTVLALVMGLLWAVPLGQAVLIVMAALWWLVQTARLALLRQVAPSERGVMDARVLATGLLVLAGLWSALVYLHAVEHIGSDLVLLLLALVWIADSAAYFAGRRWGRVKLAPVLSPGKTWVGVYAAFGGAMICALGFGLIQGLALVQILLLLLLGAVTALSSVVGDLYESLLKRRRGIKDSGQLLPGHGGLLDRIDSLTAAAPTFALGIGLLLGLGLLGGGL